MERVFIDLANDTYPVSLDMVRKILNKISLPANPTPQQLAKYGFFEVFPSKKPSGLNVTEGRPRLEDNVFYQTWTVHPHTTLADKYRFIKRQLEQRYRTTIDEGFFVEDRGYLSVRDQYRDLLMYKDTVQLEQNDDRLWYLEQFRTKDFTHLVKNVLLWLTELKQQRLKDLFELEKHYSQGNVDVLYEHHQHTQS